MGTAMKYPVPDRVKPSFVIFDIWALWRSALGHMATVGVKRLNWNPCHVIAEQNNYVGALHLA